MEVGRKRKHDDARFKIERPAVTFTTQDIAEFVL